MCLDSPFYRFLCLSSTPFGIFIPPSKLNMQPWTAKKYAIFLLSITEFSLWAHISSSVTEILIFPIEGYSASFGLNTVHLRCTLSPNSSPSLPAEGVLNSYFDEGQVLSWLLGKDIRSLSSPVYGWLHQGILHLLWPSHALSCYRGTCIPHLPCRIQAKAPWDLPACSQPLWSHCGCHGNSLDGLCHHLGERRIVWDSPRLSSDMPTRLSPAITPHSPGPPWGQGTWSLGHSPGRERHKCLMLLELLAMCLQFQLPNSTLLL